MSIPTSFNPLGALGESSYIPPGWHRVDFLIHTATMKFRLDAESRPLIDDIVVLRYHYTEAQVALAMCVYGSTSATAATARVGWQSKGSRNFSSTGGKFLPGEYEVMSEVAFDREGVLVNGVRFHTQPRDKFDDYTHNLVQISSDVAFYGSELKRDGKLVSKLVPYVNGNRYGLADTVNKKFYEGS